MSIPKSGDYLNGVVYCCIFLFIQDCIKVVTGGVTESTELLKERFDQILYTGKLCTWLTLPTSLTPYVM